MKKYILTAIISLLAGTSSVWANATVVVENNQILNERYDVSVRVNKTDNTSVTSQRNIGLGANDEYSFEEGVSSIDLIIELTFKDGYVPSRAVFYYKNGLDATYTPLSNSTSNIIGGVSQSGEKYQVSISPLVNNDQYFIKMVSYEPHGFTITPSTTTDNRIVVAGTIGTDIGPTYTITDNVTNADITSSASTFFTITGNQTATTNGNYDITFTPETGTPYYSSTATQTLYWTRIGKPLTESDIAVNVETATYKGEEYTLADIKSLITVKDGDTPLTEGTDYTVTLASGTYLNATTYNDAITITGTDSYSGTIIKNFTISKKTITTEGITITPSSNNSSIEYDGTAKSPSFTVVDGSYTLIPGTDYELDDEGEYTASTTAVGSYTTKIKGKGNYTGTTTGEYEWAIKKSINNGDGTNTISVTIDPATYKGAAYILAEIKSLITVKDGETKLTEGTDYTVTLTDGTYLNAMRYVGVITIAGAGNYTGTRNVDFTIAPRNISDVTVTGNSKPHTGSEYSTTDISEAITLTYNGATLSKGTGTTDDYSVTVTEGTYKEPGIYTGVITLTARETGAHNFEGTRVLDFIIGDACNIADCEVIATTVYNGSAQTPTAGTTVIIRNPNTNATLTPTTDYTITPATSEGYEYVNAKTYANAITITAAGSTYYGSKTVNYVITPKSVTAEDIVINNSTNFNDETIVPADVVTVTDNGLPTENKSLTKGTDYTIAVSAGYTYHDPGTYANAITITGKGNYTGEVTKDFIISNATDAKNIADGKLLVTSTAIYTGAAQVPSNTTVTVLYDGTELGTSHYDITYAADTYINAQTYSGAITITAKGTSYYGTVTADYVIAQRNMNDAMVQATEVKKMEWTGSALTPVINGGDATTNNINLKLVTTEDDPTTTETNEEVAYSLVSNTHYTYTVEPTPIKEAGAYTITFEGRGNFTGTKQLTVHVVKDLSDPTVQASISLAQGIVILPADDTTPFTANDLVVKDGDITMNSADYTAHIYEDSGCATEVTSISSSDTDLDDKPGMIYYVKLEGKPETDPDAIYINSTDAKQLVVLKPYQTEAMPNKYGETVNVTLHLTEVTSAEAVNASLGNDGSAVIGDTPDAIALTVPGSATYELNNKAGDETAMTITASITGIEAGAFAGCANLKGLDLYHASGITEIANGAFTGCTALRYIDLSSAEDFVPSSLERNVTNAPFSGVPKQALVYLNGTTFTGENYVYKPGTDGDYFCELFKIYDDISGSQTSFSESDGYKWAFENRHNFTAYTVTNTRRLTADKHYTVCLPYNLPLPANVKAYTLEATSSKLFGFKEVTGTTLAMGSNYYPVPYVLIPSVSGELLSTTDAVVQELKEEDMAVKLEANKVVAGSYAMYPNMRYSDGTDAQNAYIMQYNSGSPTWKQITAADAGYAASNKACILPMRAYIKEQTGGGGSRERMGISFTDLDGTTTVYDLDSFHMDEDATTVYDLQGRRLKNDSPVRKGIYMVNGKKVAVH